MISEMARPVTGTHLADTFNVTRQVIVQDIAILRAAGHSIVATPQGYVRPEVTGVGMRAKRSFVVCHSSDPQIIELELNTIVDLGGRVIDVTIEHPVYGDLTGALMIRSRRDVQEFIERLVSTKAEPLLVLREGVHLHAVEAHSEADLDLIGKELKRIGLLLETDDSI